jgi:exonuclease VII small subunit
MNKTRRKNIEEILQALEDSMSELVTERDDEQEYFDNMPESFQGSERGEKSENAISSLTDLIDNMESGIADIRENCGTNL